MNIGISIGQKKPELIVLAIEEGRGYLLSSFSDNKETKDIPVLVIAEKGNDIQSIISPYKKNHNIEILFLSKPVDIQGFKSKVTALLKE